MKIKTNFERTMKQIEGIELTEKYSTFCENQENCVECELVKRELIYNNYDQPCKIVWELINAIQNLKCSEDCKGK